MGSKCFELTIERNLTGAIDTDPATIIRIFSDLSLRMSKHIQSIRDQNDLFLMRSCGVNPRFCSLGYLSLKWRTQPDHRSNTRISRRKPMLPSGSRKMVRRNFMRCPNTDSQLLRLHG